MLLLNSLLNKVLKACAEGFLQHPAATIDQA
jgi:hypothetical protein